ncbi:hypothetical protein GCM10010278_17120 [Streptomyces melanogenes]|nr:hypothetical protein GCM10010278_17120 [Streptomyces melanogenes]
MRGAVAVVAALAAGMPAARTPAAISATVVLPARKRFAFFTVSPLMGALPHACAHGRACGDYAKEPCAPLPERAECDRALTVWRGNIEETPRMSELPPP